MCRFAAYIGRPIILEELLFEPSNSLVKQSVKARETDEPLNGDGFGLGWYAYEIDFTPGLYRSIQPAWNDRNLISLSQKLRTNCCFAHVRAASEGGVSILNCHPFQYKRFLFMHNGGIGGFKEIKRYLRRELNDNIYDWVQGQTDSEHLCALFLNIFESKNYEHTSAGLAKALKETFAKLFHIQKLHNVTEASYLNVALTDGHNIIATRFSTTPDTYCPTLYYSAGSRYESHEGICHMHPREGGCNEAILIVSERLTNYQAEWVEVPVNHMLIINQDLEIRLESIPFEDKN